jgi:hypothetical protein
LLGGEISLPRLERCRFFAGSVYEIHSNRIGYETDDARAGVLRNFIPCSSANCLAFALLASISARI